VDRPIIFALIGLACGTFGALQYVSVVKERLSGGQPEEWLVLRKDMRRGDALTADALDVTLIPELYSDSRRVPAKERDTLLGIPVNVALRAGEGLYWTDVSGADSARSHLAEVIPPGRRAFRLPPQSNPFGLLVEAGDLVDVLCVGSSKARTVLEGALVLAVGDKVGRTAGLETKGGTRSEGLSLSVLPEEAEALLEAEKGCPLKVVLRSPEDIALQAVARLSSPSLDSADQSAEEVKNVP
jgi:Flp pilus assembly protein CpaB